MRRSQSAQNTAMVAPALPGYDYGSARARKSPVTLEEFDKLKLDANFTDNDVHCLRQAGKVLADLVPSLAGKWRDIAFTYHQSWRLEAR